MHVIPLAMGTYLQPLGKCYSLYGFRSQFGALINTQVGFFCLVLELSLHSLWLLWGIVIPHSLRVYETALVLTLQNHSVPKVQGTPLKKR